MNYLENLGFEPQFGARPIKRVLQKQVLNELSKQILSENIIAQQKNLVDIDREVLVFRNV